MERNRREVDGRGKDRARERERESGEEGKNVEGALSGSVVRQLEVYVYR